MKPTGRRQWTLLFIILFFTVAPGCFSKKDTGDTAKIGNWYARLDKHRYANADSVLFYTNLIDSAAKDKAPEYKAMAAIGRGVYKNSMANYQLALKEFTLAIELLKQSDADSLKAKAWMGIGIAHNNLGNFPEGIEYLLKALRMFEKLNHRESISSAYSQLSQVYQLKGELQTAKDYVQKGLNAISDNQVSLPYLINLHTLANIYGMSDLIDSALQTDAKGLLLAEALKSASIKGTFYDNKANCYVVLKKYDSAAYYYNQCLLIDSAGGNFKQLSDTYLNMGYMYLQQHKLKDAEVAVNHSIKLAEQTGYQLGLQFGWAQLAEIYTAQNNLGWALVAKDSTATIKDRIINTKSQAKIAELEELYESEKKEQTISLQKNQLTKQKIISAGIIAFSLALGLAGYAFYRRNKLKKENEIKEQLHQQQQQAAVKILEAEEQERKRIATDLHDGVGQLMMAAWLNLQAIDKDGNNIPPPQKELLEKAVLLVDESCKEVRAVSHNLMPNALLKKGLINAVRDFVQQLNSKVISVNLQVYGLQMQLEPHVETILYRVIQECVNNVLKHAAASNLDISINSNEDGIDVLIEDNGRGFIIASAEQKDGLGLQSIRSRVAYLSGNVDWDTSEGNGTVVSIHIPAKE